MKINIKRAYDGYSKNDGYRILVDRLWPRGIKKVDLKFDFWAKEIAPTSELRKWFSHDPKKWQEFKKKYYEQLDGNKELIQKLISDSESNIITLLYSAKDTERNQAVVIREYIEDKLK